MINYYGIFKNDPIRGQEGDGVQKFASCTEPIYRSTIQAFLPIIWTEFLCFVQWETVLMNY